MDSGAPAISASLRGRIIALYGAKLLRKSAMNIRGGAGVFERVMAGKGYRTALEIGTYRGVSAAEMARYCERVITVDLRYGRLERSGDSFDRVAFWHSLGIENVELALVDVAGGGGEGQTERHGPIMRGATQAPVIDRAGRVVGLYPEHYGDAGDRENLVDGVGAAG